ncbi:hypothetical protein DFJ73DRAFT_831572 [Zopfochytrium polystomum]|nr:hypothetical protein DFJ73DRAFT_831572 [Zopfochytrium polystomum]
MPLSVGDVRSGPIEISIPSSDQVQGAKQKKKRKTAGLVKADRELRVAMHKAHLLCLLVSLTHRNRCCNDPNTQAFCLSLIPESLVSGLKAGTAITSAKGKGRAARSKKDTNGTNPAKHPFVSMYLRSVAKWWKEQFPVSKSQPMPHPCTPESIVDCLGRIISEPDSKSRAVPPNLSALLFVAAMRGVGIKCRLVGSLHPVPLSLAKAALAVPLEPEGDRQKAEYDETLGIRLWAEVFAETEETWVSVDPSSGAVAEDHSFEPPVSAPLQLYLTYVIACEQEFWVKDVTRRYSSQWNGRTLRLRLMGEDEVFWNTCLWLLSKSDRTAVDEKEDVMLETAQVSEKMPSNLAGFKNHPLFALERHCTANQIIFPKGKEFIVGKFKDEDIYPRSHLKDLLSRQGWLYEGRVVKQGEEPMKRGNARAYTVNRKREIEAHKLSVARGTSDADASNDPTVAELFGEWQTEDYVAAEIVDGIIPKNAFKNFELLHPNMLPSGASHIRDANAAVVAKQLGVDFAKAVTGFEFRKGASTPILDGIVVGKEFAAIVKEAAAEHTAFLAEKAHEARTQRALSGWMRLTRKLMVKARLMQKYT